MTTVLCLRPQADFSRVDALPPPSLSVRYHSPTDGEVPDLLRQSVALVIAAVGPKLAPVLFEDTRLKLIQVTGAGLDRLDIGAMTRLDIPVANVPGGSNGALAEYAVTAASTLLRRFLWADSEIKRGNYQAFRARLVAANLRRGQADAEKSSTVTTPDAVDAQIEMILRTRQWPAHGRRGPRVIANLC
jgi:D-isomer specific 2-hydroxyacid dehydrogenase, catalytic domain